MNVITFVGCLLYGLCYMISFKSIDASTDVHLNNSPIIGLLAQEVVPDNYTYSYISAGYVKAIESAGARVVPILINKTPDYYRRIIHYINGVVIPGGGTTYGTKGGFYEAVSFIYDLARERNDAGVKLPILGVCQGMEVLAYLSGDPGKEVLVPCLADKINLPLNFKSDAIYSRLYGLLPATFYQVLATKPVTVNHHSLCLTEYNMYYSGVSRDWKSLSTNRDKNNVKFISSMEHRKYPFAGVQFHPEKPAYEWHEDQKNPHDYETIHVNRYFYDWVVNMARLNWNHFPNGTLTENLIYNYPITFLPDGYDTQYYFFNSNDE